MRIRKIIQKLRNQSASPAAVVSTTQSAPEPFPVTNKCAVFDDIPDEEASELRRCGLRCRRQEGHFAVSLALLQESAGSNLWNQEVQSSATQREPQTNKEVEVSRYPVALKEEVVPLLSHHP